MVYYALALFLAFMTEASVEYIFGTPMDKIAKLQPFKWLLMYAGLAVGIGLCFWYQLDIVSEIYGTTTTVGIILTGLAVGRGSNFVNDLYARYVKPQLFPNG